MQTYIKSFKLRRNLCCTISNGTYLISCKLCKERYVGSAFKDNFEPSFWVNKSYVISGKDRCRLAKHFLTKCTDGNKDKNSEVQLIEQVRKGNCEFEKILWRKVKWCQEKILTRTYRMNSIQGCYIPNIRVKTYVIYLRSTIYYLILLFCLSLYYLSLLCRNIKSLDLESAFYDSAIICIYRN